VEDRWLSGWVLRFASFSQFLFADQLALTYHGFKAQSSSDLIYFQ
jgi:hypothetical protein